MLDCSCHESWHEIVEEPDIVCCDAGRRLVHGQLLHHHHGRGPHSTRVQTLRAHEDQDKGRYFKNRFIHKSEQNT